MGSRAVVGHLGHAADGIYDAAPRPTLSSRILHASGTAAALVDEWLRRSDSSAAAAVASRAGFHRSAIAPHSLTFSGNDPGLGKRERQAERTFPDL